MEVITKNQENIPHQQIESFHMIRNTNSSIKPGNSALLFATSVLWSMGTETLILYANINGFAESNISMETRLLFSFKRKGQKKIT